MSSEKTMAAGRYSVPRRLMRAGTSVIYPAGLCERWGISSPTRWRWEHIGKIPARDVFIGGVAVGWKPETIAAAESGGVAS